MDLLAPRSKDDRKPHNSPWKAVPSLVFFLFFALFFAFKAAGEKDAASRQQTSSGMVAECKHSLRGTNYCHYMFSTADGQYTGISQASSEQAFGQGVTVYYDSQDPRMNALEDFSAKSREDENWVYIFLLVVVVFVAVIFYSKAPFLPRRTP